jgi:hypothetical protein
MKDVLRRIQVECPQKLCTRTLIQGKIAVKEVLLIPVIGPFDPELKSGSVPYAKRLNQR